MELMEELKSLGADVNEALDRIMGDASLYEMMLGMFVDSVRDTPVCPEDFDRSDLDDLIKRVHTLKGITGNLSLTPLFNSYTQTLGLLRGNQPKEAKEEFLRLMPVQEKFLACINRHAGGAASEPQWL